MTTHLEISIRLAKAIGWNRPRQLRVMRGKLYVLKPSRGYDHRLFDYRDPAIIWPVAERFNAFPVLWKEQWRAKALLSGASMHYADTAAEAVAMAVIKLKRT